MNEFVSTRLWPIITLIIGAILHYIFTLLSDSRRIRIERERIRKNKLENVYKALLEYVRQLPHSTLKVVLRDINVDGKYDEVDVEDIRKVLNEEIKNYNNIKNGNDEEFKKLKDCYNQVNVMFSKYELANNNFYGGFRKYSDDFECYAPNNVIKAYYKLCLLQDKSYNKGKIKDCDEVFDQDKVISTSFTMLSAILDLQEAIAKDKIIV